MSLFVKTNPLTPQLLCFSLSHLIRRLSCSLPVAAVTYQTVRPGLLHLCRLRSGARSIVKKNYSGGAAAVTQAAAPESSTCPSAGWVNFGPSSGGHVGAEVQGHADAVEPTGILRRITHKKIPKMPWDNDAAVSRSSFAALYN